MRRETAQDGEYRYKRKFIWFPTHFSNGVWVWLERVYVRQVYLSMNMAFNGWYNVCLSDPETGLPLKYKE